MEEQRGNNGMGVNYHSESNSKKVMPENQNENVSLEQQKGMDETIQIEENQIDEEKVNEPEKEDIVISGNSENSLNEKKKTLEKRTKFIITALIFSIFLNVVLICASVGANSKRNKLLSQNQTLQEEKTSLDKELSEEQQHVQELQAENEELKNGASKQLVDVKNAFDKEDWENTIKLASALHEKYNGSEEDIQAQEMAKQSQEKLDEIKAAKEAEEAQGYETGITYDQLARTPDDYKGKKVKFYGKVVQVIEGDKSRQIRLAVNSDYDTILFGQYDASTVSSRVLEDDMITIYGTSVGTVSYQSTMGGKITIPGVYIEKIEQ